MKVNMMTVSVVAAVRYNLGNYKIRSFISKLRYLLIAFGLSACVEKGNDAAIENSDIGAGQITSKRLANSDSEPGEWMTGGRDFKQSYYSPLKNIDKNNAHKLGFAWQYEINTTHGFEATPIVIDGVMFASGPKGAVYSLDAKTGKERWAFEPTIDPGTMRKVCCGPINRGLVVWLGNVYVASLDGYLYALDANTGAINWRVDTITERDRGYTVTGAPYIANNVVVIGNSGAELDARGYVTAYDVKTGQKRWRFFYGTRRSGKRV